MQRLSIIDQLLVTGTGQSLSMSGNDKQCVCECCFRRVSYVTDLSDKIEKLHPSQLCYLKVLDHSRTYIV